MWMFDEEIDSFWKFSSRLKLQEDNVNLFVMYIFSSNRREKFYRQAIYMKRTFRNQPKDESNNHNYLRDMILYVFT